MKNLKTTLLLMIFFQISLIAQINFQNSSWQETLTQAQKENKFIFVDIYTSWCGPCKKLSKTTFQDKDLGKNMNEKFISVKWDAESKEYEELAKNFGVNSYPTLLYLSSNGELIYKVVGFKTVEQLKEENDVFYNLKTNVSLQEKVENYEKLSELELQEILKEYLTKKIEFKTKLFDRYYSLIEKDKTQLKENLLIILDNINANHSLEMYEKVIENISSSFIFNTENMKLRIAIISDFKKNIESKKFKATQEKNKEKFARVLKISEELVKKESFNYNKKEVEKNNQLQWLIYYSKTEMKDEYLKLSQEVIKKYVDPSKEHRASLLKRDSMVIRTIAKMREENEMVKDAFNESVNTKKDLYLITHIFTMYEANLLYDISKKYSELFDDKKNLKQASKWALLSLEYVKMPHYYINAAKILIKIKKKKKAQDLIDEAFQSEFLDKEDKKELKELQQSI